jgi:hypothetical protein
MDSQKERFRQLDAEGICELFVAANEYHAKHSKGAGGSAMCICGQSCGGSAACRGLSVIRDVFRYADFQSHEWRERFEFVRRVFD